MKKFYIGFFIVFALYAIAVTAYFLQPDLFAVSPANLGTPADPATFMTQAQIDKAVSYSRIQDLSYFLEIPLKMVLLVAIIGVCVRFRNGVEQRFRNSIVRLGVFVFLFTLLSTLLYLPVDYFFFVLDHRYGISNETIGTWLSDTAKNLGIEWLTTSIALGVFYWVARKSPKRWWVWFWVASIPLILFLQFIQPVVLDPLFNDYRPLQNQQLKKDILALAHRADIPANQVYEVDISKRTNAINAYVTGIGGNARIVLWDTTLQKLKKDEILVIMAHEMGHYVRRDVYWSLAGGILASFAVFWAVFHLVNYALRRWGSIWGLRGIRDFGALPLILLIISILYTVFRPVENIASRYQEHHADMYAMKMTGDGDAAIRAFQKIAKDNLSTVTDPPVAQWFLGSHPTIEQRIDYFQNFHKNIK